ncbi:MAG: glycerol kinase GlpK [Rikenellaceae bacterium]|nr:glycerol kinase GlpK [Rikenellaceae bacterium]
MKNNNKYILALDQGTTSSRAIIFDNHGNAVSVSQHDFEQHYPQPGWVEHDPNEIWYTQSSVAAEAVARANLTGLDIACIGITNQRETVIVWDRNTSNPIYNAIVWQDRRTADYCSKLIEEGYTEMIRSKTGLIPDAYFSATKLKWILDNVEGARERAKRGELCFGTVDSWLVWKFTRGKNHITDVTNASRTMLFNIHTLSWDSELLKLFDIPAEMLPEVKSSSEIYCNTATTLFSSKIPISGIAGDQQAALFGQLCIEPGMAKTTYGTGCFLMINSGDNPVSSHNNLLTTIAWQIGGKVTYALEGSVFVGGAAVQWIRDGLKIISDSAQTEQLANSAKDNNGVYFVPALTGLGAPYWDQYARGTIFGLTRGTTIADIARATLEGIAFEVHDVLRAMEQDVGHKTHSLRVDGGAVANNFLMQFQADLGNLNIIRPKIMETTALGAAYLAGLAVGIWSDIDQLKNNWQFDQTFTPQADRSTMEHKLKMWHRAVRCAREWSKEE